MGDIDVRERCEKYRAEAHLLTDERDAALAEVVRLRSVVAGVEALAERWTVRHNRLRNTTAQEVYELGKRDAAEELRSVLSDTKGDAR